MTTIAPPQLFHYDTMNNPEPLRHGLGMQTWSHDDGLSWSVPTVLDYPPQVNMGAMVRGIGTHVTLFWAHILAALASPPCLRYPSQPLLTLSTHQPPSQPATFPHRFSYQRSPSLVRP